MATPRINETRPLVADRHGRDNLPPASPSPATQLSARNHGLDNLRAFLTTLVILHHTAIVYGGAGGWKLRSRCFPPESVMLITFNAIDQTFFMALFFFMSGHFTRIQMSKKRALRSAVIRSRLLRILLPAMVYTMLVEPTLNIMVWAWDKGASDGAFADVWSIYLSYWTHVRGIRGPVWYLALVMIFDMIAVLFLWSGEDPSQEVWRNILSQGKPFWAPVAWVMTILSSFAVRLVYPVGKVWAPLSLQLAYLPQYVLAYFGGHFSAVSDDLFVLIPFQYDTRNALRKLFLSLMLSLLSLGLLTVMEEKMMGIDVERVIQLTRGGLNIPALVYAAWNEMGFALIGFALVAAFLQYGDFPWTCGNLWLPRYSYGAFLLHPPVSLGIELALESFMGCQAGDRRSHRHGFWPLFGPMLMTLVVGLVNILASWTAAWSLLSTVPLVSRII